MGESGGGDGPAREELHVVKLNACVVGLGTSDVIGAPGRSPLRLQFESFRAALRDANLDKADVDGLVTAWGARGESTTTNSPLLLDST
ncbi:hypothetical protein GQ85_03815 [Rhodococcus rhodochrous]|nr:hypothetical protein GQ85_03815 [Rhodococcus rhodochrous]